MIDEKAEKQGDLTIAVIEEIRRDKAERRKPLNTIIKNVTIHAGTAESADILDLAQEDITGTCKIEQMKILARKGKGKEIRDHPSVRFVVEY
jgi:valyl-tRNA synthetase